MKHENAAPPLRVTSVSSKPLVEIASPAIEVETSRQNVEFGERAGAADRGRPGDADAWQPHAEAISLGYGDAGKIDLPDFPAGLFIRYGTQRDGKRVTDWRCRRYRDLCSPDLRSSGSELLPPRHPPSNRS